MSRRAPSTAKLFPRLPQLPLEPFTDPVQRAAVVQFNERLDEWYEQINGRLSLGDTLNAWSGHIDGERLIALSAGVDGLGKAIDFPVAHNLGRIPTGYLVTKAGATDGLAQKDSTPAATSELIWFNCAAAAGTRYEVLVF